MAHIAGHIDFDDLNWETRKYNTKAAYCQSKLALVLFTKELSRRLQGVCVMSFFFGSEIGTVLLVPWADGRSSMGARTE